MADGWWRGRDRLAAAGLAIVSTLAAIAVLRPWASSDGAGGLRGDAATIARGAAIYAEHCANCHGASLEGQPDWQSPDSDGLMPAPPHNSAGHTWHHDSATLFGIAKHGLVPPWAPAGYRSNVPAFGDRLTGHQIWAVLSFIASSWGTEERSWQHKVEAKAAARQ